MNNDEVTRALYQCGMRTFTLSFFQLEELSKSRGDHRKLEQVRRVMETLGKNKGGIDYSVSAAMSLFKNGKEDEALKIVAKATRVNILVADYAKSLLDRHE